jgi:hypothetical protein
MTKTKTKDNRTVTQKLCDKAMEPIVKKANQWGYVMELARQFGKRQGGPIHRQTVDTWLHRDPAKRVRPDYGTVIMLLMAAEDADKVFAAKGKAKA